MDASPMLHRYGERPKTFHNLIQLLSTKIDTASRCSLYEGEARAEGTRTVNRSSHSSR